MNKINTEEDIRKWAEDIVAAKGEKFTPLSKGDQFAIAKYILDSMNTTSEDSSTAASSPENGDGEVTRDADKGADVDLGVVESEGKSLEDDRLGHLLHRDGKTAQKAYDEFLEWCKTHPSEASVMDFSTGKKSSAAAFAYWLFGAYAKARLERW